MDIARETVDIGTRIPRDKPGRRRLRILVTCAGRRVQLLQAFRSDGEALGIDVDILAADLQPEWSAACRLADASFATPVATDPGYADAILDICAAHGVSMVIPCIDPELLPLSLASARFEAIGVELVVSAPSLIEIARDKLLTAEFFDGHGIRTPKTALAESVCASPDRWRWPLLVKPRHGSAGRLVRVVHTPRELADAGNEPLVAQELLRGEEFTVNMFFDRASILRATVPHRRVGVRAGEVEKGVTCRIPELAEIARRMAECLPGPRGTLCYQAMLSADGIATVFEINARFGGGYPLAHRAGAKFTRWLLEERSGLACTAQDEWEANLAMLRYDAAVFIAP